MRIFLFVLTLFGGALALSNPTHSKPDLSKVAWEKLSDRDGITVYRWETEDSPLFAFKAEASIDAPIAKVAQVLVDTSRRKEWVPSLIEAKVLRQISDRERVEYTSIETPPLTANRDFVLHAKAEYVEKTRELIFHFTSTEDSTMPPTDMIRGEVLNSRYLLKPTSANKTYLEYMVHVDPKGSIARWLVNMVQKNIPRNTIEAIRLQVKKPDIEDLLLVKKLYVSPTP